MQTILIAESRIHLDKESKKREKRLPVVDEAEATKFEIGDYILLTYPNQPPYKLASLYRGPMVIAEKERDDLFRVVDLISNKSYPVHVDRLRKLRIPVGMTREQLVALAASDQGEYVVERILDHQKTGRGKHDIEFWVKWLGYEDGDNSWEPYENLKDVIALDEYAKEHPELRL